MLDRTERSGLFKALKADGVQLQHVRKVQTYHPDCCAILKYTPNVVQVMAMGKMVDEGLHDALPLKVAEEWAKSARELTSLRSLEVRLPVGDEANFLTTLAAAGPLKDQLEVLRVTHPSDSRPIAPAKLDALLAKLTAFKALVDFICDVAPTPVPKPSSRTLVFGADGDMGLATETPTGDSKEGEALVLRIAGAVPSLERITIGEEPKTWDVVERGEVVKVQHRKIDRGERDLTPKWEY